MPEIREKLDALNNGKGSDYPEQAKWRKENRDWLQKSQAIAFEMLEALDKKKFTQKKLAELMDVTPQYINNIVRGRENLTLETICRLEKALGIELMPVKKLETDLSDHQETEEAVKATKTNLPNRKAA
jgi:plasmid maintenance system antidote protein VapI